MLRGRRDRHHRLGLLIPLTVGCILAPIQFFVGDTAAREIADNQPIKFAAMECVDHTHSDVTEYIYGVCTDDGVKWGIPIPGLDSFLVGWSTDTEVTGLDSVPADQRPPANTMLHAAFDTMVGIGTAMIALGLWFGIAWWRKRDIPKTPWFLRIVAVSGIAAIVAMESGWIVTEVGRQPWIVQGDHAHQGGGHRRERHLGLHSRSCSSSTRVLGVATVLVLRGSRAAGASRARMPSTSLTGRATNRRRRSPEARREQGRRRRGDPLGRARPCTPSSAVRTSAPAFGRCVAATTSAPAARGA